VGLVEMLGDLGPAVGQPIFFWSGGAGMDDGEWAEDAAFGEGGGGGGAGGGVESEEGFGGGMGGGIWGGDEIEIMIDGVAIADRGIDEMGEASGADF